MKFYGFEKVSTLALAKHALEARIVKLALDGKQDLKRESEGALADLTSALVNALPDRPSVDGDPLVQCFIRRSELRDLETTVAGHIKAIEYNKFPEIKARFEGLLRNIRISIAR